jgi:hypothetical protein
MKVLFCVTVAILLGYTHYKCVNYNNAFKVALRVIPEIEESNACSIPVTNRMIKQLRKYVPDQRADTLMYDLMQYFRTHGSSPSNFNLVENSLCFNRKLPNSEDPVYFRLIQEMGVWKIDSIGGITIFLNKHQIIY